MSRYSFRMNNTRQFDHAFFDTDCTACDEPIYEGDPLGSIDGEYVCIDCLRTYGDPGQIQKVDEKP